MSRRKKNKAHIKTFQQRQTELRRQWEMTQEQAIIDDMVATFSCSNSIARDFADQCEKRIERLDLDLRNSALALDFWSAPPERARPVVDALRELADERQRHRDALVRLRDRLLDFTRSEATHQHLELPFEHYQQQMRQALFPAPALLAGPDSRGIK